MAGDSLVEIDRLEALARDLRFLTRPPRPAPATRLRPVGAVVEEIGRRQPAHGIRYSPDGASPA